MADANNSELKVIVSDTLPPEAPLPTKEADKMSTTGAPDPVELQDPDLQGQYGAVNDQFNSVIQQKQAEAASDAAKGDKADKTPEQHAQELDIIRSQQAMFVTNMKMADAQLAKMPAAQRSQAVSQLTTRMQPLRQTLDQAQYPTPVADWYRTNIMPAVNNFFFDLGTMVKGWEGQAKDALPEVQQDIHDIAANPQQGIQNVVSKAADAGKGFLQNLNLTPGRVAGGLLGAIGAFLIGNVFGGGAGPLSAVLKWGLTLMLAPLLFMLGANNLGGPINNFLGGIFKGFGGNGPAQQPEVGQQIAGQQAAPQVPGQPYAGQQVAPQYAVPQGPYLSPQVYDPATRSFIRIEVEPDGRRIPCAPEPHHFAQQLYNGGYYPQQYYPQSEAVVYEPVAPTYARVNVRIGDRGVENVGASIRYYR